ncbi:hypothetical protein GCM10010399_06920 [Dactylosporangium fulvum]|uniref:Hydrolase n=1 Tax=Dactylosporangium fulvum TaxID=53359 RepID=A0ABY5WBC3_9ACTN|nr:hypothetical protein [Dactylosporangium fulvum]UWP86655.1 hypothetical protein Dfulv_21415 [Dactylosporangium fulvum]
MIQHAVFDLDETLCDFADARRRGLEHAFALLEPEQRAEAIDRRNSLEPRL